MTIARSVDGADSTDTAVVSVISFVGSFVCVATAAALTRRYGGVAAHLLRSTMAEMSMMIVGFILDMGDVVTDCITCANVLRNACLAEYHASYAALTVFALVVGALAMCVRARMMRELWRERKDSTRRASMVGPDNASPLSVAKAERKTRRMVIGRDIKSACMGLSVLVMEDVTSECVARAGCGPPRAAPVYLRL